MNGYTPKVGDKVKAALGENVVVGEVLSVGEDFCTIELPGSSWHIDLQIESGWHFEQVVSVPSKFGAVIRRADGVVLIRTYQDWPWFDGVGYRDAETATRGGFTVLFDGVDE